MSTSGFERTRSSPSRVVNLCGTPMSQPGHVCAFFDSRDQKYEVIAPYFAEAIEAGDRVINVVPATERDRHVDTLERASVPVRNAMHRHQLSILTNEETYLREGVQDLQGMLDLLADALGTAEREGYGVRTCGEMSWIASSRIPIRKVLEYEAKVNHFVPAHDCTLMCVYDIATLPSALTADILATHPWAIINNRLRPNDYFVPPDEFLKMLVTREDDLLG